MPTNHGSIEFLKFPDPQHPGDNTRLIKKWLRDSWARRKIASLNTAVTALNARLINPIFATTLQPSDFTGIYLNIFNPSTTGNPGNYYGTCLLIGYSDGSNKWLSSVLFTTNGLILYSHKVNSGSWSGWQKLTATAL